MMAALVDRDLTTSAKNSEDFVAVTGEVHLHTALGMFLEVDGRRVFDSS
jgi:hypothetical protein